VEFCEKRPEVGLKVRPVSWATVRVSPLVTAVTASARYTVPSLGSPLTVTVKAEAAWLASVGAAMPIAVAAAFSATVSEAEAVCGPPEGAAITRVTLSEALSPAGSVTV